MLGIRTCEEVDLVRALMPAFWSMCNWSRVVPQCIAEMRSKPDSNISKLLIESQNGWTTFRSNWWIYRTCVTAGSRAWPLIFQIACTRCSIVTIHPCVDSERWTSSDDFNHSLLVEDERSAVFDLYFHFSAVHSSRLNDNRRKGSDQFAGTRDQRSHIPV